MQNQIADGTPLEGMYVSKSDTTIIVSCVAIAFLALATGAVFLFGDPSIDLPVLLCVGIPSLVVIVIALVTSKTIFIDNDSVTVTYTFLVSKNSVHQLRDCTGYFSYFLWRHLKNTTVKKYGVVLKCSNGYLVQMEKPAELGLVTQSLSTNTGPYDRLMARLDELGVRHYYPNLGKAATQFEHQGFRYPLIVDVLDTKGLARKTFSDPEYNPTLVI